MLTRREIVERLHSIQGDLTATDDADLAIKCLIADLSAPPTLPEGWAWNGYTLRCADYSTILRVMPNGNLEIASEGEGVIVAQNIVRAALELAEEGK